MRLFFVLMLVAVSLLLADAASNSPDPPGVQVPQVSDACDKELQGFKNITLFLTKYRKDIFKPLIMYGLIAAVSMYWVVAIGILISMCVCCWPCGFKAAKGAQQSYDKKHK